MMAVKDWTVPSLSQPLNQYIEVLTPNLTEYEDGAFKEVEPHLMLNKVIIF